MTATVPDAIPRAIPRAHAAIYGTHSIRNAICTGGTAIYDWAVATTPLIAHLRQNALRTDGPFTLRSGEVSDWYLDARKTTFSGQGAWLVGQAVLDELIPAVEAVGGLTMGADPIAMATAMVAADKGRQISAFSIRKEPKAHGTGGRLVGPVEAGAKVAILEDTTTTGSAALEATLAAEEEGLQVVQAIVLVDRSNGKGRDGFESRSIPYVALITPEDLGVEP